MAGNSNRAETLDRGPSWMTRVAPSRLAAAAGFGLFFSFTAIILIRRIAGAFSGSISLVGYIACLLFAGLISCGLKVTAEWPPHRLDRRSSLIFGSLIGLPLDVLAIALLPADWSFSWLAWALILTSLVGWFCLSTRSVDLLHYGIQNVVRAEVERFLVPAGSMSEQFVPASSLVRGTQLGVVQTSHRPHPAAADTAGQTEVLSELQRRSSVSGADVLEGQLTAVFAAGARQTVLHVPFIPPFAEVPRVECEVADGSDSRIKVGTVFPYGVRLELKRSTPDLPELHVTLEIYAGVGAESPAEAA